MDVTRSKLFALVIALGYLGAAIATSGWDTKGVAEMCLVLSLPLALIWFPDELSPWTYYNGGWGRYTKVSPPFALSLSGWLCLVVVLPLIAYLATH